MIASSVLPECNLKSYAGISCAYPQPVPSGTMTSASIVVSSAAVGSIGSGFAGLSYEKSTLCYGTTRLFSAASSNLIGLFQTLGTGVFRIGGASADVMVWTPAGAGQTAGQVAPSDVDRLAAFVKATGWKCLYCINLAGSAGGTTTPALAAAEVAYVAQAFGSSLLGIEIGNEPNLYPGIYYPSTWALSDFETLWLQYRAAIVAVTPTVKITGPATSNSVSTWAVPFGKYVTTNDISLLTAHYYAQGPVVGPYTASQINAEIAALLTSNQSDGRLIPQLQSYEQSTLTAIPFRMSECNSIIADNTNTAANTYATAIWALDYMFTCAANGASGVNFHGGPHMNSSALDFIYTPILDASGVVTAVNPEYYGILMFALAGTGTLKQVTVSAGSLNVAAYAVKSASGGSNVVVINKDSTNNLQLTLTLPQSVSTAKLLEMTQLSSGATAPSLSATTGVTIQNASVSLGGVFAPGTPYSVSISGSQLTCYVPALSAVLIQTT